MVHGLGFHALPYARFEDPFFTAHDTGFSEFPFVCAQRGYKPPGRRAYSAKALFRSTSFLKTSTLGMSWALTTHQGSSRVPAVLTSNWMERV